MNRELNLQIFLDCVYKFLHTHPVKITIQYNQDTLTKAAKLTGIKEKSSLVQLGLEALIARENSRKLARLGGSEKSLRPPPRRQSTKKNGHR